MPVEIPKGVEVKVGDGTISAKGPKGELREALHPLVRAEVKEGRIILSAGHKAGREVSALYGTSRARINNLVQGVATGFTKVLDIVGLGFRAEASGQKLTLSLGKTHPVAFEAPQGVAVSVDAKKTQITFTGPSRELVGEAAAKLRALRRPEPYKGTGIRYQGEHVRKKAGKTAAGAGAAAGGKK